MEKFRNARIAVVVQGVLNHLSHTHAHDCESASTQGKVLRLNDPVPQKLIQVHSLWHDGPLNLDEHRGEEAGNHEVQRIVRHHLSCAKLRAAAHFNATCSEVDPLPEEELWVGQLLVLCLPLA